MEPEVESTATIGAEIVVVPPVIKAVGPIAANEFNILAGWVPKIMSLADETCTLPE